MFPIGTLIRNHRIKNGLTQMQLAQALGVSTQTVSKWESGTHLPDPSLIPSIARILHILMVDLAASYFAVPRWELKDDYPAGELERLQAEYWALPPEEYAGRLRFSRKLYEYRPERFMFMYIGDLLRQKENRGACLAEARALIRSRITHPQCDDNEKYTLLTMILYEEEEEKLEEWLSYWPPEVHFIQSKALVLAVWYACRGEEEKYTQYRGKLLQKLVNDLHIFVSVKEKKRPEEFRFLYDILHILYGDRLGTSPRVQIGVCVELAVLSWAEGAKEESVRLLSEAERWIRELMEQPEDGVITSDNPLLSGRETPAGEFHSSLRLYGKRKLPSLIPEEMQREPQCGAILARIQDLLEK